ncbi:septum site-determining protein Ssd, partial [Frankia canadensis]|uniref:septum site-determining protein Ssd n=1 Tax=Frankia canadensis TaxID=1836972 RepID=UPI0010558988
PPPTVPPSPGLTGDLGAPPRPLIVTGLPGLIDDLLRLAAAAGVSATVAVEPTAVRRYWSRAPLVIVGMDRAAACVAAGLPPRPRLVLAGGDVDDGRVWSTGARLGADHVVFLPEAELWLMDAFGASGGPPRGRSAATLGVVSGRRGSGASTVAVSLAIAGLCHELTTVLVDADPRGGGLGPAFSQLLPMVDSSHLFRRGTPPPAPPPREAAARADARPASARTPWRRSANAPERGDLTVMSWDPRAGHVLSPSAMATVLGSVDPATDLTIVDLPWQQDPAATLALGSCETALVVLRADPHSVATADRVCAAVRDRCADVRAVVRRDSAGSLAPAEVSRTLGVPLAGVVGVADIPVPRTSPGRGTGGPATSPSLIGEHLLAGLGILGGRVTRPGCPQ